VKIEKSTSNQTEEEINNQCFKPQQP